MVAGTYTLSVRDYDELRGYLAKHYKIVTRRPPDHSCELYYITKSRTFSSLPDLVKHYQGKLSNTSRVSCRTRLNLRLMPKLVKGYWGVGGLKMLIHVYIFFNRKRESGLDDFIPFCVVNLCMQFVH